MLRLERYKHLLYYIVLYKYNTNYSYDCLWYKLSKKNRALINIIMIRSCKECVLTGGSIVHLSLETFGKVSLEISTILKLLYILSNEAFLYIFHKAAESRFVILHCICSVIVM